MPEQHRVVDLRLTEPRLLVPGGEDLHGHVLPVPDATPHLPVAPFAYAFHQRDLPGYSSLNKKGQPGAAARRAVLAQQALRERSRAVSQRAQQGSGTVTPQAMLDPSTCSLHPFGDLGTRARGALR